MWYLPLLCADAAAANAATDAALGRQLFEYCEGESFVAECPDGFAVLITRAVYGRMRSGRCVVARHDGGCSTDVMAQLDWRCSGRPACRLPVTDLLQGGAKPCPMEYRSYLEASYECIPGQ
jgi:Galactose binding lectin domain